MDALLELHRGREIARRLTHQRSEELIDLRHSIPLADTIRARRPRSFGWHAALHSDGRQSIFV
jgi:hypothetical protein